MLPANNVVPQGWMTQRTEGLEYDSIAAVPNYFYGQVLVRAVIVHQWWWRVYPMRSELAMGRTRVWMSDAPAVKLRALARKAGVPVVHHE